MWTCLLASYTYAQGCGNNCAGHLQIWLINKVWGAMVHVARHKLERMHLLLKGNGHYSFCRKLQKDADEYTIMIPVQNMFHYVQRIYKTVLHTYNVVYYCTEVIRTRLGSGCMRSFGTSAAAIH